MNKSKYIKMNDGNSQLSLGNFFEIIKKESNSKNAAIQSELFCVIFDLKEINETTVNNYCTGYRAINYIYKQKYINLKKEYALNKMVFREKMLNILSILDDYVYLQDYVDNDFIKLINEHKRLKNVCSKLYNISKNDMSITDNLAKELFEDIETNNLYECIIKILFFIILEKKQPIYIEEEIINTIQNAIYNTAISANDVTEFLNIKLVEGAWAIRPITELAKRGNPYACIEMAGLEFYGQITGKPRYEESYNYYKIAGYKNHPIATWFIGFMHYRGYVGNKSENDYKLAWEYFLKAEKLGCIATINSIGIAYLEGKAPEIKGKDEEKATKYFKKAAENNYVYAFNNLGLMHEKKGEYKKAFELYLKSADLGQSWAANRVGDYYRLGKGVNKDEKKAYEYYVKSSKASIYEICMWSKYNLAKYYYKNRK